MSSMPILHIWNIERRIPGHNADCDNYYCKSPFGAGVASNSLRGSLIVLFHDMI